jgi:hypothetical protein
MITEFLICDAVTNEKTWVAATSLREALIKRENELRAAATTKTDWRRAGKPALPAQTKASHYSQGDTVNASLADVTCIGQRQWVMRNAA